LPTTTRTSSPSSASQAHRRSCASPRATGCVERFIRTLKENLLWVRRFDPVEELRLALHQFKETYNQIWSVERHGYQTPAAIRAAQLALLQTAA
jgi:putative transposase